jgi:hypothetical protein
MNNRFNEALIRLASFEDGFDQDPMPSRQNPSRLNSRQSHLTCVFRYVGVMFLTLLGIGIRNSPQPFEGVRIVADE